MLLWSSNRYHPQFSNPQTIVIFFLSFLIVCSILYARINRDRLSPLSQSLPPLTNHLSFSSSSPSFDYSSHYRYHTSAAFRSAAGVLINPILSSHLSDGTFQKIHAATILSQQSRGNHRHLIEGGDRMNEVIVLLYGKFLFRTASYNENTKQWTVIDQIISLSDQEDPVSIEVEGGVCHAVKNVGAEPSFFVSYYHPTNKQIQQLPEPDREYCKPVKLV